MLLPDTGDCDGWSPSLGDNCVLNDQGWANNVPACGNTGDWLEDNDSCTFSWFSCNDNPDSNIQTCR